MPTVVGTSGEKEQFISDMSLFSHPPSHSPTTDNKQRSSNAPTGRDKFDVYESLLMPLSIPVWHDALKVVKRDKAPASYCTWYRFPEAAIFASTNEAHCAKFFATWNVF